MENWGQGLRLGVSQKDWGTVKQVPIFYLTE